MVYGDSASLKVVAMDPHGFNLPKYGSFVVWSLFTAYFNQRIAIITIVLRGKYLIIFGRMGEATAFGDKLFDPSRADSGCDSS